MTDISALQSAVDKLKTTAQDVVDQAKTGGGGTSDVTQAEIDALVSEVDSVESELATVRSGAPTGTGTTAAAGGATQGASLTSAVAAPGAEPAKEQIQPPWQASS